MPELKFDTKHYDIVDKWARLTRTFAEKDSEFSHYIDKYAKEWKDKQ